MRFYTCLIALVITFSCLSQVNDTIYYDTYWDKTKKDKAVYYRPLPLKKQDGLYVVKDYFINGNLQMEAFSTSLKNDVFQGDVIWYYDNGQISLKQTFDKGKTIGNEVSYFRDGTLMSSGVYKNGSKHDGTFYLSSTSRDKTSSVNNGNLHAYNTYYESTKTMARQTIYDKDRNYEKSIYFDKKGDTIAVTKEYNKSTNNFTGYSKIYFKVNKNANVLDIVFMLYQEYKNNELNVFLRDKDGKTLAKGRYKNGRPFEGQFFKDNRLETYKNGIRDGEAIFYDEIFNEIASGVYRNGAEYSGSFYIPYSREIQEFVNGKLVAKITKNKFTNQTYRCVFDNYTPIEGVYYTRSTLETYKAGKRIKQIDLNYDTGKKKSITYYDKGDYIITKKVYFKEDTQYEVQYKDGIPFEGKELQSFGYNTYKNGETNGPFLIEDNRVTVQGNYIKDFKQDGEIRYVRKHWKDTLYCTFRNGKPIDGTTYELGNLTRYKNGKKQGCAYKTYNNSRYIYDSLQICYENDVPKGIARYYFKDSLVAKAEYKNGQPYNGTFFNFVNKKVYAKGNLVEKYTVSSYNYIQQEFFDHQTPIKTLVRDYKTNDIKYIMNFKKGKPYSGKQIVFDSVTRFYLETSYVKGKKHGLETKYKYLNEDFLTRYTFNNGKKNGEAIFNAKFAEASLKATYSNDRPVEGSTVEFGKDFITTSTYNEGKVVSKAFYTTISQKFMCAIAYENEMPFEGMEVEYIDKKRIVKKYNKGMLTRSYFGAYRFLDAKEPNAIYKIYHYPLKDSMVSGSAYKSVNYLINYEPNSNKTAGTITFSKNDSIVGQGGFKKGKLKFFNFKLEKSGLSKETITLSNSKLLYLYDQGEFKVSFKTDATSLKRPVYKFFYDLVNIKPKNASVDLFLDSKKPLSSIIFKDGMPYDGVFFMPEKDYYTVYKVKKGKRDVQFVELTKEEVIEKVIELQKE